MKLQFYFMGIKLAEREGFSLAIFCKFLFPNRLWATDLLTAGSGATTRATCSTVSTFDISISCSGGMDGMDRSVGRLKAGFAPVGRFLRTKFDALSGSAW
jgi:hypothetical protein